MVAATALSPRTAAAQSEVAINQVLAALAAVVKDRAKSVATGVIRSRVESALCSGQELRVGGADLRLGSTAACARPDCPEVVFAGTCRLLKQSRLRLTDPQLLKTLTRDTAALALRLAARKLSRVQFEALGLDLLAPHVHDLMEELSRKEPDLRSIGRLTLDLVEQLETRLRKNRAASTAVRWEVLDRNTATLLQATSQPTKSSSISADLEPRCAAYFQANAHAARLVEFAKTFGPKGAFTAAREKPCSEAYPDPKRREACAQATIDLRLAPALLKADCSRLGLDPDPRATLRNLWYLIDEKELYLDALGIQSKAHLSASAGRFEAILASVRASARQQQPQEQMTATLLADALAFLVALLRGLDGDRATTTGWLKDLRANAEAANVSTLTALRKLPLLEATEGSQDLTVRRLRESFKQLLVSTEMQIDFGLGGVADQASKDLQTKAAQRFRALLDELAGLADSGRDPARLQTGVASLRNVWGIVKGVTTLLEDVAKLPRKQKDTAPIGLLDFATGLKEAAGLLELAVDRDWIEVALRAADRIPHESKYVEIERVLAFARVLMSMYRAKSVEDAKAAFHSVLEDESSREQRFGRASLDVAALLGGRGALTWVREPAGGWSAMEKGGGLFAPFGLQFGYNQLGVLVYPLDLGAYIMGSSGDRSTVKPEDAIRVGIAIYVRFSKTLPLVLGSAVDYRPKFDHEGEMRFTVVFLAMELPLFLIR